MNTPLKRTNSTALGKNVNRGPTKHRKWPCSLKRTKKRLSGTERDLINIIAIYLRFLTLKRIF